MNKVGAVFIGLTIVLTVVGQLLVKHGMTKLGAAPASLGAMPGFAFRALLIPANFFGLASAVAAAFCWMAALSRCELSFAYPFMALAIVLVLALTPMCYGERVSAQQWVGVCVVTLGLVIAARG
jgi:drug/metabolite transporter (DMT)-like permease